MPSLSPEHPSVALPASPQDRDGYLERLASTRRVDVFVANAGSATLDTVRVGTAVVPVVVNDGLARDCYLISASAHYHRYTHFEFSRMTSLGARAAGALLGALDYALGGPSFNRAVHLNNWLLTTSPCLLPRPSDLRAAVSELTRRFPGYCVTWRLQAPPDYLELLRNDGWIVLPHRPVYRWQAEGLRSKVLNKSRDELRSFARRGLSLEPGEGFGREAYDEMRRMYRNLYIDRHCPFNADFTSAYFAATDGTITRAAFVRHEGRRVGFMTWRDEGDEIVPAVLGYLPEVDPRRIPVYRFLVSTLLEAGRQAGRRVFLSTGVGQFKRLRGARPEFEYEAVWMPHSAWKSRLSWELTRTIVEATVRRVDIGSL
jgi:hypothetical protein